MVLNEFPDVELQYNPRDSLMPERGTLNIEKARNVLGYEPQFKIEKGFSNYIQWYREFHKSTPIYLIELKYFERNCFSKW